MMLEFIIYVFMVLGAGAVIIILASVIAQRPKGRTVVKLEPYESGIKPFHEAHTRFPIKFYIFAMAFLVFDVEVALLLPYVPVAREPGLFLEVLLFFCILALAYIYLVAKGALRI